MTLQNINALPAITVLLEAGKNNLLKLTFTKALIQIWLEHLLEAFAKKNTSVLSH